VSPFHCPPQRRYAPAGGDLYRCEVTFDAFPGERIYGLGQHQHGLLDQKGAVIELIQRNTEVCIPFAALEPRLWILLEHGRVGRVEFGTNRTRWVADGARQIDYWVTAGSSPAEIVSRYTKVTGLPPMLPQWASGFWQCKLRYRSQHELLESRASTSVADSLSPSSSSITSIGPVKASGDLIPPSGRTRKRW